MGKADCAAYPFIRFALSLLHPAFLAGLRIR